MTDNFLDSAENTVRKARGGLQRLFGAHVPEPEPEPVGPLNYEDYDGVPYIPDPEWSEQAPFAVTIDQPIGTVALPSTYVTVSRYSDVLNVPYRILQPNPFRIRAQIIVFTGTSINVGSQSMLQAAIADANTTACAILPGSATIPMVYPIHTKGELWASGRATNLDITVIEEFVDGGIVNV